MIEKFRTAAKGEQWSTERAATVRNAAPIAKLSPRVHNFPLLEEVKQAVAGSRNRARE